MNKKLLALAISGAVFGTQAVAVELYNEDGTAFSVGGHVSVNVNGSEKDDASVGTNSPRINFNATQELGNGFTADAKGEWALNYLDGGDDTFTTRLGYVGLTHDELGRAVAGTQWAPYYDVAGSTDMPIAFANDFLYDNHGALGTGRADKMLSYRNAFDLGEAGEFSFGLGWQGDNDVTTETETVGNNGLVITTRSTASYGDRVQATLGYSIAGVKLGYAFNTGDFTEGGVSKTAESHLVSAAYGSYGSGLYLAGIYASNENMNVGLEESTAYELLAAYALANSLNLSVNYEVVEGEATKGAATQTDREELALQAEYNFTSNFVGYTGYQFDLNDETGYKSDDKWTLGARYYL
ncbi:porin [Vibrio crassostreae]|uniref:porin n=1 Tax=Vibrio crassostreae TaxID=246167 RepID=UPI000F4A269C|nr:porin [Vibrio crassostreae]ROP21642.1 putative porin [Vibrio crassostreae]ROP22760.1 putative porin [Vibrio crassostreae]RPE97142.1 putative porin [Vibrio crassostreae]RPF04994.1 putative porin [Vibrio crassostreae]TCN72666.1 putative porin [Vibrio crassostreae]